MALATNRLTGDTITAADINGIATQVNTNDAGGNNGAVTTITHSSSGSVTLDMSTASAGWFIAASANITDMVVTNGPAAGLLASRLVFVEASAAITVAFGSIDVPDADIPTSMANGESFAATLLFNGSGTV